VFSSTVPLVPVKQCWPRREFLYHKTSSS
jgi:hypothetical protein